jgi:hypothetical protein
MSFSTRVPPIKILAEDSFNTSSATGYKIGDKLSGMSDKYQSEEIDERVACQQILEKDHSVFSVQRVMLPEEVSGRISSERLLRLYLEYVEQFTLGIIRVAESSDGVEFHLARGGLVLIRFAAPLHEKTGDTDQTTLQIAGGFLVQPLECDRGQLDFIVEKQGAGTRLTLQLADYCPLLLGSSNPSLLRKWLYRLTQAYIHKVVTVRFLRMVYRQLTGRKPPDKTVMIVVRKGENI